MTFALEPIHYIVFLVLIKCAVMAIVAALLANFGLFSEILFTNTKDTRMRFVLAGILVLTFQLGVWLRFKANYHALDLSVSGLFLTGVIVGFLPSFFVAVVLSLIIFVLSNEYLTIVSFFISAIAGSILYSPDFFSHRKQRMPKIYIGMLIVCAVIAVIQRFVPASMFFTMSNNTFIGDIVVAVSDLLCVFLAFFIWNHHYTKIKLVENSKHLQNARLAILSSKINPHFLFNTLNTIASAIRLDAEMARQLVFKLSDILRYTLRYEGEFMPLSEEIRFIENYLSIENIRFGNSRLKVNISVDKDAKTCLIPTMLMQPIVENAIKHGITPLTERGGVLNLGVHVERKDNKDFLVISINDNGVGMEMEENRTFVRRGIGVSNVRERLNILYGKDATLTFNSELKKGTNVVMEFPARRQL